MDEFGMEVTDQDGCAVVAVRGEVDLATAPALKNRLLELVTDGVREIVVDLTATEFLDSTGLGAVVAAYKRVRAHDGHLRLVATSARVKRVFEITNLDRVVPIFTSVAEACAAPPPAAPATPPAAPAPQPEPSAAPPTSEA